MNGGADNDNKPALAHLQGATPRLWQWLALAILVTLIGGAWLFAYLGPQLEFAADHVTIREKIRDLGMWGQAAIIALMVIHSFVPFPAEFVALAAGNVYGTFLGTILTWTGAMMGALLSFGLTRYFGRPFVTFILPQRQQIQLDNWTRDQGATTLFISRFIPIIAFNLINYAAGLTRISWWTFTWTTGLGILPLTTLMVYMGDHMQYLSWPWLLGLSGAGIVAMIALHVWLRRRAAR